MKKTTLILLTLFSIITTFSFSQTALNPGDIMFLGINADESSVNQIGSEGNADEFLFLLLEPVTSGTEIYFTDMGYVQNSSPYFQTNINNGCVYDGFSIPNTSGAVSDGMIKWTATSNLSAGTQVLIRTKIAPNVASTGTVSIVVDRVTGGGTGMSLTGAGETIHAFQGTINGSNQVATATLLCSLRADNLWQSLTQCQFTSTLSGDPNTGFDFEWNASSPNDNGVYTGTLTGDKATIQAELLKTSNWVFDNSTIQTMPISGGFTLSLDKNVKDQDKMRIYPNPVSHILSVNTNKKIESIIVYDCLGKKVKQTSSSQVDFSNLSKGIYVLKVFTSEGITVKKIIKE